MTDRSVLRRVGILSATTLAVVAVSISSGAPGAGLPGRTQTGGPVPTGIELVSFDSCESALNGFRAAAAAHVGPYGFGGDEARTTVGIPEARANSAPGLAQDSAAPAASQAAPQHSTTNTHEAGVDEPDLVKTDGRRVVTITGGLLRVVDVATRQVTGVLDMEDGSAAQLLVSGDRALVVVSAAVSYPGFGPTAPESVDPTEKVTGSKLVLVDLSGGPRVLSTLTVDGNYVDARQVGGVVRVVVRSTPRLGFVYPTEDRPKSRSLRLNRDIVEKSTVDDWLPGYRLDNGGRRSEGRLVDCDRIRHAVSYSGTSTLTVLTFDLTRELGRGDPVAIVADGETVYGTERSLYVAEDKSGNAVPTRPRPLAPPNSPTGRTGIHRFDIAGAQPPRYVGSAQVEGTLLNQYSLSEYAGHLRVATTIGVTGGGRTGASRSMVTVLAHKGDGMVEVGRLDGLGVGERIYAVRFLGQVGYVVTFRQTDPLYTLDLSDPARPRAVGELKITGYSAYLHPAGDGRLIGVGQEATEQGSRLGTQVSLFDVGAPGSPQRIAQYLVAGGSSEVEFDPHAFLFWPQRGLLVIPVTTSSGVAERQNTPGAKPVLPTNSAMVLRVEPGRITELGRVAHPTDGRYHDSAVRRALVIGDELWTVSDAGVMVNTVDQVAQRAWLPFH